jgi:1,4-alpha-glucan branching enzyme
MRLRKDGSSPLVIACNFTPVPRRGYRVGVPHEGYWNELLNSNATIYSGTNEGNFGGRMTDAIACHGFDNSLLLDLPPLTMVGFKQ